MNRDCQLIFEVYKRVGHYRKGNCLETYIDSDDAILYLNKTLKYTEYYSDREKTILHRLDGPAIEWKNGSKTYLVHNILHRLDGPAVIRDGGLDKKYYINGKLYNEEEYWNLVKKFKPEDRGAATDLLDI